MDRLNFLSTLLILAVEVTFEMAFRRVPLKRITGAEQRGLFETKLNLIAWIWSFGLNDLLFVRCCVFASAKSCRKVSETYSYQGQLVIWACSQQCLIGCFKRGISLRLVVKWSGTYSFHLYNTLMICRPHLLLNIMMRCYNETI